MIATSIATQKDNCNSEHTPSEANTLFLWSASPKVSHKRVFTLVRWQPGSANTLVFKAFEPFSSHEFRVGANKFGMSLG